MGVFTHLLFLFSIYAGNMNSSTGPIEDQSYSDCVVKYRSAWGEDCAQCPTWKDSYVVYLKNTCSETIDVMICVQEDDKKWRRFQHTGMAPGDSLRAYACVGTGKYLAWGRRAGDESTVFPSVEEVNRDYGK